MTPADETAREAGIFFENYPYEHAANSHLYGLAAAEKLGLPRQRVFKTLVIDLAGHGLRMGLIPASNQLNMKMIAQARGEMRRDGYCCGGCTKHWIRRGRGLPVRAKARDTGVHRCLGKNIPIDIRQCW